jgi:hypothetical protein
MVQKFSKISNQLMVMKTIFVLFLNPKSVVFEVAKYSISAFSDQFKNKIVYYKSKGRILLLKQEGSKFCIYWCQRKM